MVYKKWNDFFYKNYLKNYLSYEFLFVIINIKKIVSFKQKKKKKKKIKIKKKKKKKNIKKKKKKKLKLNIT